MYDARFSTAVILARISAPPADERLGGDAGGDELASRRQCHRLASRLEVSPPALSIGAVTLVWVLVQKHGLLSNAPHSSGGIVSVAL